MRHLLIFFCILFGLVWLSSEVLRPQDATTSTEAESLLASPEGWSDPVKIYDTKQRCKDPKVAVDDLGVIHVAWAEKMAPTRWDIFYSKRESGGQWTEPDNLSGPEGVLPKNGNESPWIEILAGTSRRPRIPNVVYTAQQAGVLEILMHRFISNKWQFVLISQESTIASIYPSLAIDQKKDRYYVIYCDETKNDHCSLKTRYLESGVSDDWLDGKYLSQNHSGDAWAPDADCDDNGKVYLVYNSRQGGTKVFYTENIDARDHETWEKSELVSSKGTRLYYSYPEIAVDWDGNAHVVWMQKEGNIEVHYRRKTNAGWDKTKRLSDPKVNSENPVIAVDKPIGHVYTAWEEGKEIILRYSEDGTNWGNRIPLTKNHYHWENDYAQPNQQDLALFVTDQGAVHLVFVGIHSGKPSIYHMFKAGRGDEPPAAPRSDSLSTYYEPNKNKKRNKIRWKANPANEDIRGKLDFYRIYRKELGQGDDDYEQLEEVDAKKTKLDYSYDDIKLDLDKKHEYVVRVIDLKGIPSEFSDSLTEEPVFKIIELDLEKEENKALFSIEKIITLTWKDTPLNQAVQDRKFNIYRKKSTDAAFPSTPIATVDISSCTSDTNNPDIKIGTYKDRGLNVLDSYVYAITVEDSEGNESDIISKGEN